MSGFSLSEHSARAIDRLSGLVGMDVEPFLASVLTDVADPDAAVTNLERWVSGTSSPRLHLEQLVGLPRIGGLLVTLLGASQPMADSLIQNPELASLLFDSAELRRVWTREALVEEGRRMLASATSQSYALDRLRYLKQRFNLPIVVCDLAGLWPAETVWRALSDLAEALVELAIEATWPAFARLKDLEESCPISVIAFGKLGGHELNYSSDIDLVYVLKDGTDERTERECGRFCESLGRSLADRMGRGSVYRVDLRLRPYGAAGPILRSMKSYESYYRLYAEHWEVQALLRSRWIAGFPIAERWDELIQATVFRPHLSEVAVAEMLNMRERIEELAQGDDLKRGAGGIRDVEFLTQALQMANGHRLPAVQVRPTADALRALGEAAVLDPSTVRSLIEGYTFLRQLEHRTQLVGDQQTHSLPESEPARLRLARLMSYTSWRDLSRKLQYHRRTIQSLYRSTLKLESGTFPDRDGVVQRLGRLAPAATGWFDSLPEAPAFYKSLLENEGSLERVAKVTAMAPRLLARFRASVALTEQLLSGEIEEQGPYARLASLPIDMPASNFAEAVANEQVRQAARWILNPSVELETELAGVMEGAIAYAARRCAPDVDVIALGSFGTREVGPGSDADLIFLTGADHVRGERQGQELLAFIGQLARHGASLGTDVRLRPDGGKGLLVRTDAGLRAYELGDMEMWERFALGHARLIQGRPEALEVVLHAAYALPLTPERLAELVRMKRRIETERVLPQYVRRHVKLGYGGLNDIEWLVHLTEMRFPTGTTAGASAEMPERIRALARAGQLNALEVEELLAARRHLLNSRARIWLMDFPDDLVPENPDRLDRLAEAFGEPDGNAFLRRHEAIIESVRSLYLATVERLAA